MGRAAFVLLALALLLVLPVSGRAEPVLTLLYTGKSFGEYKPCPS